MKYLGLLKYLVLYYNPINYWFRYLFLGWHITTNEKIHKVQSAIKVKIISSFIRSSLYNYEEPKVCNILGFKQNKVQEMICSIFKRFHSLMTLLYAIFVILFIHFVSIRTGFDTQHIGYHMLLILFTMKLIFDTIVNNEYKWLNVVNAIKILKQRNHSMWIIQSQ